MRRKRGFTLVEMLTVIVIILILGGITMRLMALVNRKTALARASSDLERVKSALTEYYAAYGCYPPVDKVDDEGSLAEGSARPAEGFGYSDGLVTYLFKEDDENQERWAKYLSGWPNSWAKAYAGASGGDYGNVVWSNLYRTILDPWDRSYIYQSTPPYQSFTLYSLGPDGKAGTGDDVGNRWTE